MEPYLEGEEMFLANYGDGLSDLDLPVMIDDLPREQRRRFLAAGAADGELRHRQIESGRSRRPGLCADPSRISGSMAASSCSATRFSATSTRATNWFAQPFQRLIEKERSAGAQVHRLLAVHGHFQGQTAPGGTEPGHRSLEGLESGSPPCPMTCESSRIGQRMISPEVWAKPAQMRCRSCAWAVIPTISRSAAAARF